MAQIFSDEFITDTGAIGAPWTASGGATSIVGGRARLSTNNPGVVITTTAAHPLIADVKVSLTQAGSATADGGPCARVVNGVTATLKMYAVEAWSTVIDLVRYDGTSTAVVLESTTGIVKANDSRVQLEVRGSGNVQLKKWYRGNQLGSNPFIDSSANRIDTPQVTGIHNWAPASGVETDYDSFRVDDLERGTYMVGGVMYKRVE